MGFGVNGDTQEPIELLFSKDAAQDTSTSRGYLVRRATRVLGGAITIDTAQAADSVLTIYVAGVAVGTLTLPAGDTEVIAQVATNAGYFPATVTVAWTDNPPNCGCTVHVDLI